MITLASNVAFSPAELRQLRLARAVGFAKAAIRRAICLGDDTFLPEALELLEAV